MSVSINEDRLLHTVDYNDHFDTGSYLKEIYSGVDIDPNEAPFSAFFIDSMSRILKNGPKTFGNKKALEFGGGPNLWPSFLLAQYVESIRFCDYACTNLNAVQKWVAKEDDAFNWTTFFAKVLDANRSSIKGVRSNKSLFLLISCFGCVRFLLHF